MAIEDITEDIKKLEKIRYGRIMKAKDAKSFAILVTAKTGQHMLLANAEELKRKIESRGYSAFIISMDEITNERLMGIKCDAFVNTACPRIADAHWDKPFVNANDIDMVLE
jgi:2-(3-amino-3-carboxypropyl)histidine synthase